MKYEYERRWGHYERKRRTAEGRRTKEKDKKKIEREVLLQYREYEVDMEAVVNRVVAHCAAKGNPPDSIESIQIYAKPEDFTAYYVINDGIVGRINLF